MTYIQNIQIQVDIDKYRQIQLDTDRDIHIIQMDGWMDGGMDGWMHGGRQGWMDGWIERERDTDRHWQTQIEVDRCYIQEGID